MILKIFITILIVSIFLFVVRFLKKFTSVKSPNLKKEEDIVDLEKDPKTNEYKPKK